jgi:type IV pilus assembly protein PilM
MKSILKKARIKSQANGRPPAAVEITLDGVLAAAIPAPGQPAVYAFQPFAPGVLQPGIGEPNLRAPETVSTAIRAALDQVSPRTHSVTVIIPDTVVRVFVLDFDSLPPKQADAFPVLRFRLRKMVPFDVEHAGISYQILTEKKDETKVLAAVIPGAILAEYEAAVRAAGYEPGAVLSSSLAALEAVGNSSNAMEAVLIANLSPVALTTSITSGQDLLLYRTLDLPEDPAAHIEEVRRGVAVASAYYEDRLGAPPMRLHFAGSLGSGEAGAEGFTNWLDGFDLSVVELAPRPATGATNSLGTASIAAVAGALAGVR